MSSVIIPFSKDGKRTTVSVSQSLWLLFVAHCSLHSVSDLGAEANARSILRELIIPTSKPISSASAEREILWQITDKSVLDHFTKTVKAAKRKKSVTEQQLELAGF